ncbi:MAG: restriction endonuclease [Planctomycetota bacterium]
MPSEDFTIVDVGDTTLDEWFALLKEPPDERIFIRNMFPTDRHRGDWMRVAHTWSDRDVKTLLRSFLVSTGSNLIDECMAESVMNRIRNGADFESLDEHDRRLVRFSVTRSPVWEGIGWILDLLPRSPRRALAVLDSFLWAYGQRLTDNYLTGHWDAAAVIRTRYIESTHTSERSADALGALNWRELEKLAASLYSAMGFDVTLTPHSDDDGVDVVARGRHVGQKDLVVVQAKKWSASNPVGKAEVRELVGTMDHLRATRGVLLTTSRFTSGAHQLAEGDPRLELFDASALIALLNEHCGADWTSRIDWLLHRHSTRDIET